MISNTKLSDAGDYRCLVTNRAGEVQGKFNVEILCTHLGTQLCRELEQRHLSNYRLEAERRRQLLEEQRRRVLAMRQWDFDASSQGRPSHYSQPQSYSQGREWSQVPPQVQTYPQVQAPSQTRPPGVKIPEFSITPHFYKGEYLSTGKSYETKSIQGTEYSDNSLIQNLRADFWQLRTIQKPPKKENLSRFEKLKVKKHRKRPYFERKLLESLADF